MRGSSWIIVNHPLPALERALAQRGVDQSGSMRIALESLWITLDMISHLCGL
jgi:hypothetical protein